MTFTTSPHSVANPAGETQRKLSRATARNSHLGSQLSQAAAEAEAAGQAARSAEASRAQVTH